LGGVGGGKDDVCLWWYWYWPRVGVQTGVSSVRDKGDGPLLEEPVQRNVRVWRGTEKERMYVWIVRMWSSGEEEVNGMGSISSVSDLIWVQRRQELGLEPYDRTGWRYKRADGCSERRDSAWRFDSGARSIAIRSDTRQ
jgi:hypothetical protein